MTLDEQIAFLAGEATKSLSGAAKIESAPMPAAVQYMRDEWAQHERERAAMLLTIENTLRAVRDAR